MLLLERKLCQNFDVNLTHIHCDEAASLPGLYLELGGAVIFMKREVQILINLLRRARVAQARAKGGLRTSTYVVEGGGQKIHAPPDQFVGLRWGF
jgi:hypothetical protein